MISSLLYLIVFHSRNVLLSLYPWCSECKNAFLWLFAFSVLGSQKTLLKIKLHSLYFGEIFFFLYYFFNNFHTSIFSVLSYWNVYQLDIRPPGLSHQQGILFFLILSISLSFCSTPPGISLSLPYKLSGVFCCCFLILAIILLLIKSSF